MVNIMSQGTQIPFISVNSSAGFVSFSSLGGKHTLIGAFVSSKVDGALSALKKIEKSARFFQSNRAAFVGICCDSTDQNEAIIKTLSKDNLIVWDFKYQLSAALGIVTQNKDVLDVSPTWLLLDPMMRVVQSWPLAQVDDAIKGLEKQISEYRSIENINQPPVLILPRVFDAGLCKGMIENYNKQKLIIRSINKEMMKRQECSVIPGALMTQVQSSLANKVIPAIRQCFQFNAQHMDQCLIASYDMANKDFVGAHRDNDTEATKHRRFSVMINLNEDDYSGSEVIFPEFSLRSYKAPYGGALIFSSSLVYQQTPITGGKNHTFICTMFDDAAQKMMIMPKMPVLKSVA